MERRGFPSWLSPAEIAATQAYCAGARALLGPDLVEIRLFGSRARGEGTEDSDVDPAIIVTASGYARKRELQDLAFDLQLEHGVALAPFVIQRERLDELRRRERLIARDIDREGLRL